MRSRDATSADVSKPVSCSISTAAASDAPLAAIAGEAGFASQSHLTSLFRARFAKTPGAVRAARAL